MPRPRPRRKPKPKIELTEPLTHAIAKLVADGRSPSAAARSCGVSFQQHWAWARRGAAHPDGVHGLYWRLVIQVAVRRWSAEIDEVLRDLSDNPPGL